MVRLLTASRSRRPHVTHRLRCSSCPTRHVNGRRQSACRHVSWPLGCRGAGRIHSMMQSATSRWQAQAGTRRPAGRCRDDGQEGLGERRGRVEGVCCAGRGRRGVLGWRWRWRWKWARQGRAEHGHGHGHGHDGTNKPRSPQPARRDGRVRAHRPDRLLDEGGLAGLLRRALSCVALRAGGGDGHASDAALYSLARLDSSQQRGYDQGPARGIGPPGRPQVPNTPRSGCWQWQWQWPWAVAVVSGSMRAGQGCVVDDGLDAWWMMAWMHGG